MDTAINDKREYVLHYFLEIKHSFDGDYAKAHDHTIEIKCKIGVRHEDLLQFGQIEDVAKKVIDRYDQKYLNRLPGFKDDSTIERLGEVLCYEIDDEIKKFGYEMTRFEIGETPLRVYVITDELRA